MTSSDSNSAGGESVQKEKSFRDVFVVEEEFQDAKFRGAVLKYVEYKSDDSHIVDMRIPYQEDDDRVKQAFYDFESWVSRHVSGYYESTKQGEIDRDYLQNLFAEMYDSNEKVEQFIYEYTEKYVEGKGFVDLEENQAGGEKKETMKHKYKQINEAGLIDDDYNIQDGKMLGSMLKFAKEVDAIMAPTEEVDVKEFVASWNKWMLDKFGTEWIKMLSNDIDPGMLKDWGDLLFIKADGIEEMLEEKWEYEEEELEGNSESGEKEDEQDEEYETLESVPQSKDWPNDDEEEKNSGKVTLSDF